MTKSIIYLVILIKLRIELNNLEPKLSFGPTLQKIQRNEERMTKANIMSETK